MEHAAAQTVAVCAALGVTNSARSTKTTQNLAQRGYKDVCVWLKEREKEGGNCGENSSQLLPQSSPRGWNVKNFRRSFPPHTHLL